MIDTLILCVEYGEVFLFALLLGSFFNVCIYRIPQGESIVFPRSHCPHCKQLIAAWDNIPVLSFVLLKGRCRSCQAKISWRYPSIELLTAGLMTTIVAWFGFTLTSLFDVIFVGLLIIISFIDIDHRIIPNTLSIPGIVIGVIASVVLHQPWYHAFAGILAGGGAIWAMGYLGELVFKKEAMGGGDVTLMAMVGAFLGWELAILTIFLGSFSGAIIGVIVKRFTGDEYIPFGPFLSFGALMALLFGQPVVVWYLNLFLPAS